MKALFTLSTNLIPEMEFERQFMAASGTTLDQARFSMAFLGALLSGFLIRFIPGTKARNLFSTVVGFMLVYYPFGSHVIHGVITSLVTYVLMWQIPRKCGTLTWLLIFPYLTVLHVVNASGLSWNAGDMDFTGGQMVLTLKLISMAVSFQDAHSKQKEGLTQYQARHVFYQLPSLLEYFGFVFAFGNLLAGPVIEFRDYQEWVNRQGPWAPNAARKVPWTGDMRALVGPSGCVVCCEPAPQATAALALNLQQHSQWCNQQGKQVGRTVVLPVAVTDDPSVTQAQFTVYTGAAGWSTLTPNDAEVVANMQSYVRSLLQPTANGQPQYHQQPDNGSAADSRGWSLPQQALVWCARQLSRIPGVSGVTDSMTAAYVRLAMLRGAETVTVPTATVSGIIEQQQLACVDLLKVDVERAELQVLQGIQQHHWPVVRQVAMEVHDIDGRLLQVVSLLEQHGFSSVTTEQPPHLLGTDLHNIYATRAGSD